MIIWVDAQLSPRIAQWISGQFAVTALPLRDLGLRDAPDDQIFQRARSAGAVVLTEDGDFLRLLGTHGAPPKVIWLTCGNTSDAALREILGKHLAEALRLLKNGEDLVEITSILDSPAP